ncbi:MAG: phosphatidylglycerophosphatase A, partial [Elusimicrobiota bacterium]|nr:phosphatidylglycerophosphatase A [Elusimicrobiota bacterium]
APGTFATFLATAIWWYLPTKISYIVGFFVFITALLICGKAEKIFGIKDDQRIVIDELAGYFIAVASLPKTFFVLISSIILFRFFDIKKPFFIKSVQKLKGSVGILIDDVLAGIMTNIIIIITLLLWK